MEVGVSGTGQIAQLNVEEAHEPEPSTATTLLPEAVVQNVEEKTSLLKCVTHNTVQVIFTFTSSQGRQHLQPFIIVSSVRQKDFEFSAPFLIKFCLYM